MADAVELERLRGLIDLMVSQRVLQLTCSDGTSLVLSPAAFLRGDGHATKGDPVDLAKEEKREHYANLLNRHVPDDELGRLP